MITVNITHRIELTGHIPGQVRETIEDRLTFPNPACLEAESGVRADMAWRRHMRPY